MCTPNSLKKYIPECFLSMSKWANYLSYFRVDFRFGMIKTATKCMLCKRMVSYSQFTHNSTAHTHTHTRTGSLFRCMLCHHQCEPESSSCQCCIAHFLVHLVSERHTELNECVFLIQFVVVRCFFPSLARLARLP